jgi:SNF2 family DNA or RNA helicase
MKYEPRIAPWKHQEEALRRLEGKHAYALLCAMRTGKTKMICDDFGRLELAGECQDLLVIAPAGVYRTWETAFDTHLSEDLRNRIAIHTWSARDGTAAAQKLEEFLAIRDRPRALLVNVEALSTVERAQTLCKTFLGQRKSMAVIDESTSIKSPTAQRAKFAVRYLAPLAAYRRVLSGLPTPRSPLDLYQQFAYLDQSILGFNSYYGFRNRYAVIKKAPFGPGGRAVPIVVGYRDVDKLWNKLQPHAFRVNLEDCYDLPPKMYSFRTVELTPEQQRAYADMRHFSTTELGRGDFVTATQVIVQLLRLHQILCGHVGTEDGRTIEIPEKRTAELLDLLEEHDGKAIIWCSYDLDVRKVSEAIAKHFKTKVARFWGGNRNSREDEEKMFLTDPECRHIVATAAAGGRGRTWTVADLVVYYSNSPDLEHRSQSEERAQGVDKIKSVAYVDLIVPKTVDERMIKALRQKINMAATITGDNYKEWLI